MQVLLENIQAGLSYLGNSDIYRGNIIVSLEENYDQLGYPLDGASRNARYTRYVSNTHILRTQMSAVVIKALAKHGAQTVLCPGLVYRRDVVDKTHVGEPHQMDIWHASSKSLGKQDLLQMIEAVVEAILPGAKWRTLPAQHPYTTEGLEIEVWHNDQWLEIGECGLAAKSVLDQASLHDHTGLAMGIGLDRALMLRKGIDDIRLLRSSDPRVAKQMQDLLPYVPVSSQPPAKRDLSLARDHADMEIIGDQVREALGDRIDCLESLELVEQWSYEDTPPQAIQRLGLGKHQINVLLRLTLRHPTDSIARKDANEILSVCYQTLHQGETDGYAI